MENTTSQGTGTNIWRLILQRVPEESMVTTTSQGAGRNLWPLLLQRVTGRIYGDYYFTTYWNEYMATNTSKGTRRNLL